MFSISNTPIDPVALKSKLDTPASGACVTFEGWVRNHNDGRDVHRLEYEAFESVAVKEGLRIADEAVHRFAVHTVHCVHRTGTLEIGDIAVWVGVSASHRGEAFDACRYIIDEVKARVPIWKKEHYATGESEWVNCAIRGEHATPTGR